jgi:hypothetical protein
MNSDESISTKPIEPIGFPVSSLKFWVMSILTFDLYLIYWAYKNFKQLEVQGNSVIYALFIPLSFSSLIKGVEVQSEKAGKPLHLKRVLLAIGFFLLTVAAKIADRENQNAIALLLSVVALLPVAYIQRKIVMLNQELRPSVPIQSKFSAWDITGAVLGGIILVLALIGLFVIPD